MPMVDRPQPFESPCYSSIATPDMLTDEQLVLSGEFTGSEADRRGLEFFGTRVPSAGEMACISGNVDNHSSAGRFQGRVDQKNTAILKKCA